MQVKLKFWGKRPAVDRFREYLEENFVSIVSPTKPSEQGDYHAYATIEVKKE